MLTLKTSHRANVRGSHPSKSKGWGTLSCGDIGTERMGHPPPSVVVDIGTQRMGHPPIPVSTPQVMERMGSFKNDLRPFTVVTVPLPKKEITQQWSGCFIM